MKYVIEDYVKRPVGFMISRYYGHIFNEYNRANGDGL